MVREVSDITKFDWEKVFQMEIREFLTIVSFSRAYNKLDLQRSKQWQMVH